MRSYSDGGYSPKDSQNSVYEFLPRRLYYTALTAAPSQDAHRHYFCIDHEQTLQYWNFFLDFGPLNLGQLYRFCSIMKQKLSSPKYRDKVIYFYSGTHPHRRANAAFLICAWSMICLNRSPEEAFQPFKAIAAQFQPWHDATQGFCSFNLTILDTLRGLQKARECKFFNFDDFPIEEYEYYERVENGDLNWLMEGKFIAFAGPHAASTVESTTGYQHLTPEHYVPYFQHRNVELVIRLNKKYYDSRSFTHYGINHMDLYFLDGSNPPDLLLQKFLQACEETNGAIAVHCKAGLGRTGSCIGCYMMKHFRFTAEEVIGWLRIARPGSIIGPQQQWMKSMEQRMWHEGDVYRARFQPLPIAPPSEPEIDDMDVDHRISTSRKSNGINKRDSKLGLSLSSKMALLGVSDDPISKSARLGTKNTGRSTGRRGSDINSQSMNITKDSARGPGKDSARASFSAKDSARGTESPASRISFSAKDSARGKEPPSTRGSLRLKVQEVEELIIRGHTPRDHIPDSLSSAYKAEIEGNSQGDFLIARRQAAQQQAADSSNTQHNLSLNLAALNGGTTPRTKKITPRSHSIPPSVIPSTTISLPPPNQSQHHSSKTLNSNGRQESPVSNASSTSSNQSNSRSKIRSFFSSTFRLS